MNRRMSSLRDFFDHRRDLSSLLLLLLGTLATLGVLAGCNTHAASSAPITPIISVSMTQAPPTTMTTGTSTTVSATVANDAAGAGIQWVATCASAPNCGTFTPSNTASGAGSTYTAPAGVPSGKTVAVTALSATDRSKFSATTVTIVSTVTGIFITPPLPASVPAGSVLNLAATVAGDPANLGTDWVVTCTTPLGPVVCSPSGLHSLAGGTVPFPVPLTVTPPGTTQAIPVAGTTITVTAYPTADHSFSTYTMVAVTAGISINITEAPPATMETNATAPVIAVVTNDTTNAGVTWQVSCQQAPCGTVVPTQTASGVAATFTAPPIVPSPNPPPGFAVTITAYANASGQSVYSRANVNIVAPISINLTQTIVNNTIVLNASAPLVATVSNDSSNAGVDWTVTCGSAGACGSFSPAHTASGAATSYTAPAAVPTGNTVTITATATADTTQTAQQIVTVTNAPPPNSLLQGTFVLYLSAKNSKNGPFMMGGVISGDGNGNITSGKFDLADSVGNAEPANAVPLTTPSTYSIGTDGRGQIILTINTTGLNSNFGVTISGGVSSSLTLSVVFVTPQHAVLAENDAFGNATGTLDQQNATDLASFGSGAAGLNGTYSLKLIGTELPAPHPGFFVGAAITSQASGSSYTITGYTVDQSDNGAITSVPFTTSSQSYPNSAPTPLGEILFSTLNLGLSRNLSLDLWLIDANHFVVTDFVDAVSISPVIVGGYFTAQPSSPALSGTLAFTEAGATSAAQPQVAGGILSCGSSGTVDVVPLSGTGILNQSVSAACTAPANGRGLLSITGAGSSGLSQIAAYPTIDQGLYLIELDGGSAGTSGPSGAGVAYQQTLSTPISASALNGGYASVYSTFTTLGSQNFTAQETADGVSSLSGIADVGSYDTTATPPAATPSIGATLAGTFTASSNGRFPLALTLTPASGQPSPQLTSLNPACYIVDANTCLLLGLDATAPGTGILLFQNTGL